MFLQGSGKQHLQNLERYLGDEHSNKTGSPLNTEEFLQQSVETP